ncbi:MAG: pantetheine-phosphate adenylyltransferase [Candidatus Omnitrophica bacterium]|nr:pantetheine-phosphate adenylyltransferase [Candidatus Omnitrophota bacterium]MDD5080529.1 pantetheine-phosphate adenylyltransferase [Candidatus Omnitrophota bacterium]MDD5441453.1 pantetheine-phosphate adenylyltransferase [Candidatus Omnitrophota bacterium]
MKKAVYPGTFDPITNGHIDIVVRAAKIFDEVTVAVARNNRYKNMLFDFEQRLFFAKESLKQINNVKVEGFDGLVVNYARNNGSNVIVRGLRMISDFEYEFQMALTNRNLDSEIETVFLMPHPQYSFISSRLIKEAASLGAKLDKFLPALVAEAFKGMNNEG